MEMKKKILFLAFLCFFSIKKISAQRTLSDTSEIAIVTAGPGAVLYEKFGHSAIRIIDPNLNIDLIYNFGIFDFNTPNFYTNFAKGKMYYLLAKYDFKYFIASYKRDERWLKQQFLNLNLSEKQIIFNYLENNALQENATYLYDPFFDNCATKIRDILSINLKDSIILNSTKIPNNKSLRELMDQEIYWYTWGNFGINLIAGTILDEKRNQLDYTYLPDHLYETIKYAKIKKENEFISFVEREELLLNFSEQPDALHVLSPINIFTILLIIVLFITFKDVKRNKRTKLLDFIILFSTGITGLILAYLWLFSSHTTAPNNFNLLWAFLPNLCIAFNIGRENPKTWVKTYILILLFALSGIPLLWLFGIQAFPFSVIPLLILLFVRYLFLYRHLLLFKK